MKKAKMPKSKTSTPLPAQPQEAGWVTDMRAYYLRTGTFRTEDVQRVLGGPLEQVSGPEPTQFAMACQAAHK
jgi:hypothetical protein